MRPHPDFPKPLAPAGQALRILLLEDDLISVEIVGAYLERIEFARSQLHHAATLAEALALLARAEVDLVISDMHVPDSIGAATIDALVRVVGCPVIAITSAPDPGLRDATLACGAYEFLHKSDLTEATLTRLVRLAAMQARTFRSLRESEARFRSLSALTSDWFWETDAEHRFVSMPTRVDVVTRLGREAYLGKPRWEIPGLSPLGTTWAEHRALLDRHQSFRDLQLCQVRADGARVYLQISGEPTYAPDGSFTGYHGTAKDVTGRSRAEAALRESEERFRQTFELAGSGMAHVGLDGRFLRVNRTATSPTRRATGCARATWGRSARRSATGARTAAWCGPT
jgi:PAS domain S-box-containing protein